AVIVPVLNILKNRYKSASYKILRFPVSCNLHEWPSCILHFAGFCQVFHRWHARQVFHSDHLAVR
ncbi:MAG: hypothetical protein ACRESF_15235, partial [Pseudomonas sp.]